MYGCCAAFSTGKLEVETDKQAIGKLMASDFEFLLVLLLMILSNYKKSMFLWPPRKNRQ